MPVPPRRPAPAAPSASEPGRSLPGPKIVGILNLTPDSFSDGGQHAGISAAVARAARMEQEGADILDVGGQSTRPGFREVSPEEEIARVLPVLTALRAHSTLPLSIDTYKPAVARAALAAGASLLNDIHGLQLHPELADLAAAHACRVILMHQQTRFAETAGGTLDRIAAFLGRSVEIALAAGLTRDRLILDPGIGFGKTQEQNLEILARLGELRTLGCPLLLGASRKSVIDHVLALPVTERLEGTLATSVLAVWQGVDYLRVHDIQPNLRAARMAAAILARSLPSHG